MNGDFSDGVAGYTILTDALSTPGALVASPDCRPTQTSPAPKPCLADFTGLISPGSNVLVTGAHAVLPGQALSVDILAPYPPSFTIGNPDTMHYLPDPPNPMRMQARIDVYDAGNPGFPSAASLQASVFDPTNIQAVPYLGNLLGPAGLIADTNQNDFATLTLQPGSLRRQDRVLCLQDVQHFCISSG